MLDLMVRVRFIIFLAISSLKGSENLHLGITFIFLPVCKFMPIDFGVFLFFCRASTSASTLEFFFLFLVFFYLVSFFEFFFFLFDLVVFIFFVGCFASSLGFGNFF